MARSKLTPLFNDGCRLCGAKATVKSHLLPRAFAMDARANQKDLMIGRRGKPGYELSQSGVYDTSILCSDHEKALNDFDTYGVNFVRSWRAHYHEASKKPRFGYIHDVDSDLLVRFAASVVWRHGVSDREPGVQLGNYEVKLRTYVFLGADVSREPMLSLYSFEPDFLTYEQFDRICLPPAPAQMGAHRAYGFFLGGLGFLLKTDSRPAPANEREFAANGTDKALCFFKPQTGSHEFNSLVPMSLEMGARRNRK